MRVPKLWSGAMALMMSLTVGTAAFADTSDTNAIGSQIDIQAVLPDNQNPSVTSYISLAPKGDSVKQDVEFKVKNGTDQKVTVDVEVLSGVTAPSGTIAYTADEAVLDRLEDNYQMGDYLDMPDTITLEPNELKSVKGKLQVSGLSGTLLGAVGFQVKDESKQEQTQGFSITSEMKRVVGVVVEFDKEQNDALQVTNAAIVRTPAVFNINLSITNPNASLFSRSTITYEVFDEAGQSVFKPEVPYQVSFTPKTDVTVALPWESKTIEEGKTYSIKGSITYGEQVTEFEEEFMLEKGGASAPNPSSGLFQPEVLSDGSVFKSIWFYVGAGILLLAGVAFVVWRRRMQDDE